MDTPRSEKDETRFSTPVSELDDHRFQPQSLPRAGTMSGPGTRRGTLRSTSGDNGSARPNLNQVNQELLQGGVISRDFEHAIIDDEDHRSLPGSLRVPITEGTLPRRASASPAVVRYGTVRRTQEPLQTRSRGGSTSSSRSTSPPNSVDAFAGPRRRDRANTAQSKVPSDLDLPLYRSVSRGTHRRRPTFTECKAEHSEAILDEISYREATEQDVCYPPEETSNTYIIDFEALEEFVAECAEREATAHDLNLTKTSTTNSASRNGKIFKDLRPRRSTSFSVAVPKVATHKPSFAEKESNGESLSVIEKNFDRQTITKEPRPNRFSFFSSELDSTIHASELGDLIMPGESFRDLFDTGDDGGMWWLDMLDPSEDEVDAISKAFSIHPLTCEDIKTQEAREKVELFRQYYFVCFRSFDQSDPKSEEYMEPVNIYVVVFRSGVLSFAFTQSPHAANVRKRIGRLREYVSLSSDWVCYALIDDIVDSFGPAIHAIEGETDVIEDQVFTARPEDFNALLRQIGDCRKKVMSLMRLLGGKADVIKGFAKRCNEQYSVTPRGDIGLYLGDIQDHVVTMMSNLGHFEKMLSRSHSNYLAQLSADSIAQGNRANEVLSKVTVIASVLVPLNLICGLFGMNVRVPGRESESLNWFFGILGVIGAFIVCSIVIAKRYRYL